MIVLYHLLGISNKTLQHKYIVSKKSDITVSVFFTFPIYLYIPINRILFYN